MIASKMIERLRKAPVLRRGEIFVLLGIALLWLGAISLRPIVIDNRCLGRPETCQSTMLNALDLRFFNDWDPWANSVSDITQYTSGVIAILIPLLIAAFAALKRRISGRGALLQAGTDFIILLMTTLLNGLITEISRLLVQRPRPFVYGDPAQHGAEFAHYTSFVSGHTSFATTAGVALVCTLAGRRATRPFIALAILNAAIWAISTASFRVAAGRHFVTDTLGGMLVGASVAVIVALWHRTPSTPPKEFHEQPLPRPL